MREKIKVSVSDITLANKVIDVEVVEVQNEAGDQTGAKVETKVEQMILPPEESENRKTAAESTPAFLSNKIDERDEIDDYEDAFGKVWLKKSTKWILPASPDDKIRSPLDFQYLKHLLHESAGQLNPILKKMNWHISCKAELLRWIRKLELSNDLMVARENIVDEAEELIRSGLKVDDLDTAKFILKTMGKKRGWSERDNIEHKQDVYAFIGTTKEEQLSFKKLTDYELTKVLEDKIKGL